jgi:hypothetical protein
VVAAPALVGCVGSRAVPRGMQRNGKVTLALAVPDLVWGIRYRRVAPRGVRKDRNAVRALAARPHPGDTHPNVGEEGPGTDEPQVQIGSENVSEGPWDKVQHSRAQMEAEAFEGEGDNAEAGLGLAIGPSELAVGAYPSI